MRPRFPCWLGLGVLVTVAAAQAEPLRVVKRLDVRSRIPAFYAIDPELMDRGRMVYLGRGVALEKTRQYLADLRDGSSLTVTVPLGPFLAAHPEQFPDAGVNACYNCGAVTCYCIERLLFYDRDHRQAGLHLVSSGPSVREPRHFYLHWDLQQGITRAVELGRATPDLKALHVEPIGYDEAARELLLIAIATPKTTPWFKAGPVTLWAVGASASRRVADFSAARLVIRRAYHPGRRLAAVAEYGEASGSSGRPEGFVVDLATGRVKTIAVPPTCYGFTFSGDGRTLFTYSAQTGQLWSIDVESGRRLRTVQMGGYGHTLGVISRGTLLLVRNAGLQVIDERTLSRKTFHPSRAFHPGMSNVGGSLVTESMALVREWNETLYLVRLR